MACTAKLERLDAAPDAISLFPLPEAVFSAWMMKKAKRVSIPHEQQA